MPFTPAHPAIVLPFLKVNPRYVSATGLVIGSMAPDFEYFFKFSVNSTFSHSLPGVVFFDIPVALLLALIFHLFVKQNLIRNLPPFLQRKFQPLLKFRFTSNLKSHYFPFITCSAIGALSHIFWDAFTHRSGYFARTLQFYNHNFVPYEGVYYPLWYVLQQVSSVVGLMIVIFYIFNLPDEKDAKCDPPFLSYWVLLIFVTASIVAIRFAVYAADYNLGNFVVTTISGGCIALIICGVIRFNKVSFNNG
jgi:hypothetical protein